MIAALVKRRAKSGGYTAHWLHDDFCSTLCGRDVEELQVVALMEQEKLPPLHACHGCERVVEDWATGNRDRERAPDTTQLRPGQGRQRPTSGGQNVRRPWTRVHR